MSALNEGSVTLSVGEETDKVLARMEGWVKHWQDDVQCKCMPYESNLAEALEMVQTCRTMRAAAREQQVAAAEAMKRAGLAVRA